jgi:hypothetical protein
MRIARVVAVSVAVAGLLSASCAGSASAPSAPATGSSPGATTSTSTASGTSGESPAGVLARTVTGVDPILLPTAVPASWTATTDATSDDFQVTYRSPTGGQSLTVAVQVANLGVPTGDAMQTHPDFHGDARSLYQVASRTDPTSDRWLVWVEPGRWDLEPAQRGVPYLLSGTGLTDAQFWAYANSLSATNN